MHTGKYLWDEDGTTAEITSDDNYTIVDTNEYQFEVEAYQNHNYVDILVFGMNNAPYTYSTNECEGFVRELVFDEIAESSAHDKT